MRETPIDDLYQTETRALFRNFVFSVWGLLVFYSLFFGFLGNYFSFFCVGIGAVLISPLTLMLEKRGYTVFAKFLFLVSCNFYIYGCSLGLSHQVHSEYFSIPAVMIALLITDFSNRRLCIVGCSLPIGTWLLTNFMGYQFLPLSWQSVPRWPELLIAINFFGAFGLTAGLLALFSKTIYEQRRLLVASAKLASLGEMAGGIAHEINNPLAIISGSSTLASMRIEQGNLDTEKLRQDLARIKTTSERIAKITRGLLAFARESKKEVYTRLSLTKVCRETLDISQEKFRGSDVSLQVDIPEQLHVHGDAIQLSQVFMNLILNSLDAIGDHSGEKWIRVTAKEENGRIRIQFLDSGKGISSDVAQKIMHPFFTTKAVGKGTGLGLSISKGIINQHKGELTYDGKSENTCFVIELPAA